jgi:hypothetical protein
MSDISLESVLVSNFQTSGEADKISDELKSKLGFTVRYRVARLAIGRSLGEPTFPTQNIDSSGRPLKGELLFGLEELPLWVALLVSNIKKHFPNGELTVNTLQNAVKRHWHRGVLLLLDDWAVAQGDYNKFIEILITRRAQLPDTIVNNTTTSTNGVGRAEGSGFLGQAKPIHIRLGNELDTDAPYEWLVNGVGYSPHVAIMGQAGSGKTRTMLDALKQIHEQTNVPVILLDLGKGELADDDKLALALNAKVLRVPANAIPLDMFYGSNHGDESDVADSVMGFRDSFMKVISGNVGAIQKDNIKEALRPHFSSKERITLDDVKKWLKDYYEENELKTDSVISTINDLTEWKIFSADFSPSEFFSQSWIITFAHAQDTVKNLSAYLLLDALNTWMKRLDAAPQDVQGHRSLRCILAIDEARHILGSKHKALSDIIRLHRSKGLVVMLASQSPDDYEGEADDYLENIGLPICFKTNADSTKVLENMFKHKPQMSSLQSGVCLTLKDGKAIKIKTF